MPNFSDFSHRRQGDNPFRNCVPQEILAADESSISPILIEKTGDSIECAIAHITSQEWSREASQAVDYWLWLQEQPVETLTTLAVEGGRGNE